MHGRGMHAREAYMAGGMHDRGHVWQGGMHAGEMANEASIIHPTGMLSCFMTISRGNFTQKYPIFSYSYVTIIQIGSGIE